MVDFNMAMVSNAIKRELPETFQTTVATFVDLRKSTLAFLGTSEVIRKFESTIDFYSTQSKGVLPPALGFSSGVSTIWGLQNILKGRIALGLAQVILPSALAVLSAQDEDHMVNATAGFLTGAIISTITTCCGGKSGKNTKITIEKKHK